MSRISILAQTHNLKNYELLLGGLYPLAPRLGTPVAETVLPFIRPVLCEETLNRDEHYWALHARVKRFTIEK